VNQQSTPAAGMVGWHRLFLVTECVLLTGFIWHFLEAEPRSNLGSVLTWIWSLVVMLSWLFLFLAAPFFIRALGKLALAGWFLAFAVLLLGLLFPS
jgi:hypothetical protein